MTRARRPGERCHTEMLLEIAVVVVLRGRSDGGPGQKADARWRKPPCKLPTMTL